MVRVAVSLFVVCACGGSEPRPGQPRPASAPSPAAPAPRRSDLQIEIDAYFADPWDPETPVIPAYLAMKQWMDRMCACRDRACGEEVQRGMSAWANDMAAQAAERRANPSPANGANPAPSSSAQQGVEPMQKPTRIMQAIGDRYGECMNAAYAK